MKRIAVALFSLVVVAACYFFVFKDSDRKKAQRFWDAHTGIWASANVEVFIEHRESRYFHITASGDFPQIPEEESLIYIDLLSGNVQTKDHTITLLPRSDHIIIEISELPLPSDRKVLIVERTTNS